MSQVKITSFFTKLKPTPPINNKAKATEPEEEKSPSQEKENYDSDATDTYEYDDLDIESSSKNVNKDKKSKSKPSTSKSTEKDIKIEPLKKDDESLAVVIRRGRGRPRKIKTSEAVVEPEIQIDSSSSDENVEDLPVKTSTKRTSKRLKTFEIVSPKVSKDIEEVILIESDDSPNLKKPVNPIPLPAVPVSYLKLWTEIHQPKASTDLVDHSLQVEQFKQWLCMWHETFNSGANSDYDSEDEDNLQPSAFIDGKCFYIEGRSGVGKTSMVFSVATEMGYKVLEYNASTQKFTPALIQKELSHSLQSYYIHNQQQQQKPKSHIASIFTKPKNPPPTKKQKSKKLKKEPEKPKNTTESKVQLSKSLILIDDLDGIIYEGVNYTELWRSLKQMIADARKPIVFTSSLGAHFLCSNELHYFTSVKLARISVGTMNDCYKNRLLKDSRTAGTSGDFTHLLKSFDGDARKQTNHAQFWHQDGSIDPTELPLDQSNQQNFNLTTYEALLDSLGIDDIYQNSLDHLWLECTELDERPYDRYFHDNRMSLLFSTESSQTIAAAQSCVSKPFNDDLKPLNSTANSITSLLRDHYLQLDGEQGGGFMDCFAFFYELSTIHPTVIQEIHCTKAAAASNSSIISVTRSKRRSKSCSLFAYL